MLDAVKRTLARWFGGKESDEASSEATSTTRPDSAADTGAGLRHGATPPNYVPPVDEGRPKH